MSDEDKVKEKEECGVNGEGGELDLQQKCQQATGN